MKALAREMQHECCPRLSRSISDASEPQCYRYVIYVDVAGFKAINDRLSETVGDGILDTLNDFLVQQADELRNNTFLEDEFPREKYEWCGICFGGDEFAILLLHKHRHNGLNIQGNSLAQDSVTHYFYGKDPEDFEENNNLNNHFEPDGNYVNEIMSEIKPRIKTAYKKQVFWIRLQKTHKEIINVEVFLNQPKMYDDRVCIIYMICGMKLHVSHGRSLGGAQAKIKSMDKEQKDYETGSQELKVEDKRGSFPDGFELIYISDNVENSLNLNSCVSFFVYIDERSAKKLVANTDCLVIVEQLKNNILNALQIDEDKVIIDRISSEVKKQFIFAVSINVDIPSENEAKFLVDATLEYINRVNKTQEFNVIRLGGAKVEKEQL
jgi:GGDEF domain-containing protein